MIIIPPLPYGNITILLAYLLGGIHFYITDQPGYSRPALSLNVSLRKLIRNNCYHMDMVWHNNIPVNVHAKMFRYVFDRRVYNTAPDS